MGGSTSVRQVNQEEDVFACMFGKNLVGNCATFCLMFCVFLYVFVFIIFLYFSLFSLYMLVLFSYLNLKKSKKKTKLKLNQGNTWWYKKISRIEKARLNSNNNWEEVIRWRAKEQQDIQGWLKLQRWTKLIHIAHRVSTKDSAHSYKVKFSISSQGDIIAIVSHFTKMGKCHYHHL